MSDWTPTKKRPEPDNNYVSREFGDDPDAAFARLRPDGPLSWQPAARAWLVLGYKDAAKALRSQAMVETDLTNMWITVGRKLNRDYGPVLTLFSLVPFQHEGPRHAELRRAMARALAPF